MVVPLGIARDTCKRGGACELRRFVGHLRAAAVDDGFAVVDVVATAVAAGTVDDGGIDTVTG